MAAGARRADAGRAENQPGQDTGQPGALDWDAAQLAGPSVSTGA